VPNDEIPEGDETSRLHRWAINVSGSSSMRVSSSVLKQVRE
jgi:hypothetical protein